MEHAFRDLSIEIRVDGDTWQLVESLEQAVPEDRVFTIDRQASRIRFGDGQHGARPPAGSKIFATYRAGVGASGSVASISWQIPEIGSPDSEWFAWQLTPHSITIGEFKGDSSSFHWRLLSWLCSLMCRSPWRTP